MIFCISRSRDICVNGIHRHMKVVEHSSGGIGLMIKESDLRVVQSGGMNHISNNLAYIIFSIRFCVSVRKDLFAV